MAGKTYFGHKVLGMRLHYSGSRRRKLFRAWLTIQTKDYEGNRPIYEGDFPSLNDAVSWGNAWAKVHGTKLVVKR